MSDEDPTPPVIEPKVDDWKAPADQAELDAIVEKRLARERGKFGDYEDLKAKAAEFDKAQQASMTAEQKATERAEKAEKALTASQLEASRSAVALAKGLTPNQAKRLVGATKEELEADADELLTDLAKADKPKAPPKPPGGSGASGANGTATDDDRELARSLFGSK